MTEADLIPLCQEWQKRLRLQDWMITIRLVGTREMGDHVSAGTCQFILNKRVARIDLIRQEEYPLDALVQYDVEMTLVHELLHLHMAPFGEEQPKEWVTAEEQMIDVLAGAFVALKWKGPGVALARRDHEKRNRDPEPPPQDQTYPPSDGRTRPPLHPEREDRPEGQGISARTGDLRGPGPVQRPSQPTDRHDRGA